MELGNEEEIAEELERKLRKARRRDLAECYKRVLICKACGKKYGTDGVDNRYVLQICGRCSL